MRGSGYCVCDLRVWTSLWAGSRLSHSYHISGCVCSADTEYIQQCYELCLVCYGPSTHFLCCCASRLSNACCISAFQFEGVAYIFPASTSISAISVAALESWDHYPGVGSKGLSSTRLRANHSWVPTDGERVFSGLQQMGNQAPCHCQYTHR